MKKLILSISFIAAFTLGVVGMSAFEAHVINVTAKIENALQVETTPIEFGTVFPQEAIDETIDVILSDSFVNTGRVDDVDYMIRQKPKCVFADALDKDGNLVDNYTLPPDTEMYAQVTEDEQGNARPPTGPQRALPQTLSLDPEKRQGHQRHKLACGIVVISPPPFYKIHNDRPIRPCCRGQERQNDPGRPQQVLSPARPPGHWHLVPSANSSVSCFH